MKKETATFALGCFWGPDANFGELEGVISTRVGYAGGEKEDPTYHSLGEHTETVQIEFDSDQITYEELLEKFWRGHDYTRDRKTQYKSIIFYMNDEQERLARESKPEDAITAIRPLEKFWIAEDYHQDYYKKNK